MSGVRPTVRRPPSLKELAALANNPRGRSRLVRPLKLSSGQTKKEDGLTPNDELSLGIQCINCYLTIPQDKIEAHSAHCVQPTDDPSSISSFHQITQFAGFLRTLLDSSSAVGTEVRLLIQLQSLLSTANPHFSQQLATRIEDLSRQAKRLSTRVYIERALGMTKSLPQAEVKDTPENSRVSELQKKLQAFQSARHSRGQTPLHLNMQSIENICSEVASRNSISTINYTLSNRDSVKTFHLPEDHCEDSQRTIYAMILNAKLRLPENHSSQRVSPESIYGRIQRDGVSPDDWKTYIHTCLQSPDHQTKTRVQRPCKKRMSSISTIFE